MAQISHEIGKRIRAFRKARHMTLEELAQILCKNKSTLCRASPRLFKCKCFRLNLNYR